jgi:signal transduction histidine kinase/DNA-binding response OmpR family regulator
MPSQSHNNRSTYFWIIGLSLLVFIIDDITPLGYAEWIFYVIPVALCTSTPRPQLPFIVALCLMPLLIMGYFLSPPGANETVAIINRSLAFASVWGVAFLTRRVILEKIRAQHLMWIERGRLVVSQNILGEPSVSEVSGKVLQGLAHYFGAKIAVFYVVHGDLLVRMASVALDESQSNREIKLGTGLTGQVAKDGKAIAISDLPSDYFQINSATGHTKPSNVVIAPFTVDGQVAGIMEFGFLGTGSFDDELELLGLISEKIGSAIRTAQYREKLVALLEETQTQSEELQAQQEELRVANEELGEQTRALQESQSQLELQHSELEQANVQMEERNQLLEQQREKLFQAQQDVAKYVSELEQANQYKSEFLANMSHELRTPLNSSLILSHMLSQNKTGTLTEDQVRYARTIHAANNDLLALINDILDLSKIESGQVELQVEPVAVTDIVNSLKETFEPVAAQKSISLQLTQQAGFPASIKTDSQRLQQIIKNLLSNAFKFTQEGEVELILTRHGERMQFSVRDTGIGIAPDQQQIIFEAFRQADGSTSRTYGGTGLGLSISRQLAKLLGGDVTLTSEPGKGSTFTLDVPLELQQNISAMDSHAQAVSVINEARVGSAKQTYPAPTEKITAVLRTPAENVPTVSSIPDDRNSRTREKLILVTEDDENFARILYELAHEMHFDCIHASTGAETIRLAEQYKPNGILLDIGLPDQSGLSVLQQIKSNPAIRHIPVHIISADDYMQAAYEMGAVGYALKPTAREDLAKAIYKLEDVLQSKARHVLLVEDNAPLRESLSAMLTAEDITMTNAGSIAEALDRLSSHTYDCMVMDLMLPDGSGYDLLERISKNAKYSFPPVIVYTGRVLTRDEEQKLRRYSHSIIIKGARSPERLLDEVTLFLHRVESSLPPEQQKLLAQARQRDAVFEGRKILIAEDDVRNVFALTSIFEPLGATLVIARDGEEALVRLNEDEHIDLVLMDTMMPKMDGLTAIRKLRAESRFKKLPVISLTAKAMADDRRNSLDAGASDYIAKPINVDQLISLCRVWMPK